MERGKMGQRKIIKIAVVMLICTFMMSAAGVGGDSGKGWFEIKAGAMLPTGDGLISMINTMHMTADVWSLDYVLPVFPVALNYCLYFPNGWGAMLGAGYLIDGRHGMAGNGVGYTANLNQYDIYAGARYYFGVPSEKYSAVFYAGARLGYEIINNGNIKFDQSTHSHYFNDAYYCVYLEAGYDYWFNKSIGLDVTAGFKLARLGVYNGDFSGLYIEAGVLFDAWAK